MATPPLPHAMPLATPAFNPYESYVQIATFNKQIQPKKRQFRECIEKDMTQAGKELHEYDAEHFFCIETSEKKAPLNDRFLQDAYVTFGQSLGRETTQDEGMRFVNHLRRNQSNRQNVKVRKTLTLKKEPPAAYYFDAPPAMV